MNEHVPTEHVPTERIPAEHIPTGHVSPERTPREHGSPERIPSEHGSPERIPSEHGSPEHTVSMGRGVDDVLRACIARLHRAVRSTEHAADIEDLAARQRQVIELMWSFTAALVQQLLLSTPVDANVTLDPQGPESLAFRFDSGYHGAMVLHLGRDNAQARWSVHT